MKSRLTKIVALSACLAGLAAIGFGYSADAWRAWQESQARCEQGDLKLQNMKKFETALNGAVQAVSEQNLPLVDAVDRVENAARTYLPDFLDYVNAEPTTRSGCLKESIARSIIAQVAVQETTDEDASDASCVVKRLKRELVAMHEAESKV